jgi:hypothetical protein
MHNSLLIRDYYKQTDVNKLLKTNTESAYFADIYKKLIKPVIISSEFMNLKNILLMISIRIMNFIPL